MSIRRKLVNLVKEKQNHKVIRRKKHVLIDKQLPWCRILYKIKF